MKRGKPIKGSQKPTASPIIFSDVASKFAPGSIQCIKLKNFLTFEKMTISPSPGLNLIIGPNGSGKSSIVCAIGLGLGASPQVLARTSKISGFIRHSSEYATIKILLTGNPSFWVCRRITSDNTTQWKIKTVNGKWKQTSSADVLQRIQHLHIQLDNLCMFLPQERVKEFSTLKPNQLLTATEQAINRTAFETHNKLIRDSQLKTDNIQKVSDLQANLQKYITSLDQMKNDVLRFQQVQECQLMIEKYKKKIPWVEYKNEHDDLKRLKEELREEVKSYKEKTESLKPLQDTLAQLKQKQGNTIRNKDAFNTIKKNITRYQQELFSTDNKLQSNQFKLQQMDQSENEIVRKIENLQQIIDQQHLIQTDTDTTQQMQHEKSQLSKDLTKLKVQEKDINTKKSEPDNKISRKNSKIKSIKDRIRSFENKTNRFIDHIGQRLRRDDIVKLYHFIQEHKSQFISRVYGPICLEMRFNNPNDANLVHMCVETHFLMAFLVEDSRDYDTIEQFLQDHKLNQITLMNARDQRSQRQSQAGPPPDLSRFGFDHYVDSTFQAPEAVKTMLCKVAALDKIPIGRGQSAKNAIKRLLDEEFPQAGIQRYFIDEICYIIKRSRYSNNKSILSIPVRPSNIWRETIAQGEDVKLLQGKVESIQQKIRNLEQESMQYKRVLEEKRKEINDVSKRIQDISNRLRTTVEKENKLKQINEKLNELKNERKQIPAKKQEKLKVVQEFTKAKSDLTIKLGEQVIQIVKAQKELDKSYFTERQLSNQISELEDRYNEEKEKYDAQQQRIKDLDELRKQKQALVEKKKREAQEICPLNDEENKAMVQDLPDDLEVLRSELGRYQSRYASIRHIDPTIAQRYSDAEKKKGETEAKLREMTETIEQMTREYDRKFAEWKQMLSNDVAKINRAFHELMETCNYRGEVELGYETADNISSYKLNLLVAFNRLGKLNVLSSTRQSGGEKSVTTLMYLLALQDCTKFPFRCVDEINQGMDEVNDRNTFFQVMSYAMRKNQASQYFLVTPKLLPQLDLMDGVTVMVVMNGPFIDESLNKPITFDKIEDESEDDDKSELEE